MLFLKTCYGRSCKNNNVGHRPTVACHHETNKAKTAFEPPLRGARAAHITRRTAARGACSDCVSTRQDSRLWPTVIEHREGLIKILFALKSYLTGQTFDYYGLAVAILNAFRASA